MCSNCRAGLINYEELPIMMKCDPVTGACLLPELDKQAEPVAQAKRHGLAVRYIGDPMCSWCWGMSPTVHEISALCEAEGITFSLTVGGLRAGGGDPWTSEFKDFLRSEWSHIAQVTGQPFGFKLLDTSHFNYDTEPACRAVVTVQLLQTRHQLADSIALQFFAAVQRKFYVQGLDPKVTDFYAEICDGLGLDFNEFGAVFASPEARQAVAEAFARCRQWGVRSFPTLLLEQAQKTSILAVGFLTAEQLRARLQQEIAT